MEALGGIEHEERHPQTQGAEKFFVRKLLADHFAM